MVIRLYLVDLLVYFTTDYYKPNKFLVSDNGDTSVLLNLRTGTK